MSAAGLGREAGHPLVLGEDAVVVGIAEARELLSALLGLDELTNRFPERSVLPPLQLLVSVGVKSVEFPFDGLPQ